MSSVFDCRDEAQLLAGMRQARQAIGRGELVVLPTDTVYGVAADAFSARAVQGLLDAKGRGRQSPPPVLVAGIDDAARARGRGARARRAARRGVLARRPDDRAARRSRRCRGISATRTAPSPCACPTNRLALELLEETGPLAVSSANLTGKAAAIIGRRRAGHARRQRRGVPRRRPVRDRHRLDDHRRDAASSAGDDPRVRVLREGAVDRAPCARSLGDLLEPDPDREGARETAVAEDPHA